MSNNPSPEELRRLQELAEMFDDGPAMPGTPSPERSAPSPGASEVMNAAKHWGRVFGNKAKEISEKAVEKSKEAQDAIARRAAEAKGKKEAERAQNAAAAIPSAAPAGLLLVEPETISPPVVTEATVESEDETALLERLVPMEAKALRENPAVAALIYDGMGTLPQLRDLPDEVVDPVTADQQSPSVPESIPQGAPAVSATPDHAPNNVPSRAKGWQTLAGAALVGLVLAGATAWWVTRHDSETSAVPASTPTAVAVPPVVATPGPAPVVDPLPVAVPVERGPASTVDAKATPLPVAILPVEAPATKPVPAITPNAKPAPKVSMPPVRQAAKPKASVVPELQPKPDGTNGWQEKADGDMDAWAKKAGIN
ncbi:hypothetical protein VC279_11965 [Xanthomonas sp. WHRI 10064A]|uniref:hypothetical protein n=1 Tax=unclassified Xanthomonas TaxID=2643310 RepID=UPI002B234307|nr:MULTISPECIES: hypothetical protein [unclassified Xanthomonas]MEA9587680.1 hypothetical protein [Xanthomonas sp. WHRI 10064B]MEA9615402.1 hypothetical protein [Xanthomonas sp. WHRI 10064A]